MTDNSTRKFIRMFGCDTARIITVLNNKMFLIIGWKKHTRDRKDCTWYKNGERYDFEYTEERCIASGRTMEELTASAKEYKRLSGMTAMDYLTEKLKGKVLHANR